MEAIMQKTVQLKDDELILIFTILGLEVMRRGLVPEGFEECLTTTN